MEKNDFAITPPMGWNSYDYYDTAVNEEQIKANADYMAENLKQYGWEYIVVDIEWYASDAGSQRDVHQYIPFSEPAMDEVSRLLPCPIRFPSSKEGKGFGPLASYIHNLGLKFGIHIMRGIPRAAAHGHTAIQGASMKANDVADPSSICFWNPDMYGLRPELEASQAYYDSIIELYAEWGVDFIKVDDICRMDMPSAKQETIMLHEAIIKSGRKMALSLSPGPAKIEEAWFYEKYANMWRITDDFWDEWRLLLNMFERCELWQNQVSQGCFPDCDMLPIGMLGKGFNDERMTRFTKDEQMTMMTLWSMFRSPMMIGGELTMLDDWSLDLLSNAEVLGLIKNSQGAKQLERNDSRVIWWTKSSVDSKEYLAIFNLTDSVMTYELVLEDCIKVENKPSEIRELWSKEIIQESSKSVSVHLASHGVSLYEISY